MSLISPGRLFALARRVGEKPPHIVAQKSLQFSNLLLHHYFSLWRFYERKAEARWSTAAIERFVEARRGSGDLVIRNKGLDAARAFLAGSPEQHKQLTEFRDEVLGRRVPIFEQAFALPEWEQLDWCRDWRYGHAWPQAFFRQYDFYEFDKPVPYDVKFPWELSRLNFLMIPTLLSAIQLDQQWMESLTHILGSWRKGNPTAYSVNWYPMECAMRGVNLVQLLALLAHTPASTDALRQVLVLCELHGRFLLRTTEYTDVRGNHFAAEIVALVLLGLALRGHVPEADRWLAHGLEHLEEEVLLQYSRDGVQFEKSIPYHRLVTQLFLLSFIALEQAGRKVGPAACTRLHEACRYTAAYTRPDGLAPMWGDSDDARALWFDTRRLRDHRGLTALAAAYFDDPALAFPGDSAIEPALLLGRDLPHGPAHRASQPADAADRSSRHAAHFVDGGMVCASWGRHHFLADVGEVGLNGRGGHGHLDALSFELTLNGVPLIVDPGSYIYTGDCAARNRFRGTAAHNVAMVDGGEMARLFPRQLWRLGSEANPRDVHFCETPHGFELSARHDGYLELGDPVGYRRTWSFSGREGRLEVRDQFDADESHAIERRLHFAPGLKLSRASDALEATHESGQKFIIEWDAGTTAELADDWISEAYASQLAAKTLVLRNTTHGPSKLRFTIRTVDQHCPLPEFVGI